MFKIFQTGQVANLVILTLVFLGVWIVSLLSFGLANIEPYPQLSFLPLAFERLGVFTLIIPPIAIFVSFFLLNYWVNQNELTKTHGFLVLFFGVLIVSGLPWSYQTTSATIFLLLLVLAINKMLKLSYPNANHTDVFDLGFIIGLMSITYLPSIILLVWVYQILLFLRNFSIREWLMPIIGFSIPVLYLWIQYYLMDWKLPFFLVDSIFSFSIPTSLNVKGSLWFYTLGLGLVFIMGLAKYFQAIQTRKIRVRKSLNLLFWLMVYGIIGFIFVKGSFLFLAIMLGVPGAVILSFFFESNQKTKLKTYAGWVFVIALILNIIQGFI